ncbi:MAG: chromate transporter [Blautia sp.]|nr:chromate transporter [Blautia sp.]
MIYIELFLGFLKVGLFSFGGAYSAIPLIREVVQQYGWLDDEMLTYMIAVSESTPGSLMVNLATYVGSERAGILGAAVATLAVVLPAFAVILFFSAVIKNALGNKKNNLYTKYSKYAKVILSGLMPCIIGIILATGIHMVVQNCVKAGAVSGLDTTSLLLTVMIASVYFGAGKVLKRRISPITLIGISAVLGIVVYYE